MQRTDEVPNCVNIALQVPGQQQEARCGNLLQKLLLNAGVHPRHRDHHQPRQLGSQIHRIDGAIDALLQWVHFRLGFHLGDGLGCGWWLEFEDHSLRGDRLHRGGQRAGGESEGESENQPQKRGIPPTHNRHHRRVPVGPEC